MRRKKKHIDWAEFKGNYALAGRGELLAIISGYKERLLRRNELRRFAAGLEARALHKKSPVDVYRIVNAGSKEKGVRRLSSAQIDSATERVGKVISSLPDSTEQLSNEALLLH